MELKRGFVYRVNDGEDNRHPVVIMEDTPNEGRIKGYAFTHNVKGGKIYTNFLFPKEYVVEYDSDGNKYEFQWEEIGQRRTSIIDVGLLKSLEFLSPEPIGRINEDGLKWIKENLNGDYKSIDCHIKDVKKKDR